MDEREAAAAKIQVNEDILIIFQFIYSTNFCKTFLAALAALCPPWSLTW